MQQAPVPVPYSPGSGRVKAQGQGKDTQYAVEHMAQEQHPVDSLRGAKGRGIGQTAVIVAAVVCV